MVDICVGEQSASWLWELVAGTFSGSCVFHVLRRFGSLVQADGVLG